jgi:hypothetical protein
MKYKMIPAVAAFGLFLAPLAHAQVNKPIQGKVPFNFQVGNTALPAGSYRISSEISSPKILAIQSLDEKATKILSVSSGLQSYSENRQSKLVFHRYGSTYFLAEVWQGSDEKGGLKLQPSKAERVKAREMAAAATPHNVELASVIFNVR